MRNAILAVVIIICLGWGYYKYDQTLSQGKTEPQLVEQAKVINTEPAVTALAEEKKAKTGSIIFGGDIMLARSVERYALSNGGWGQVMVNVAPTLASADCRVANLESPFASNKPATEISSMVFAAKPKAVEVLTSVKMNAVSLANNHISDQGAAGMTETMKILTDSGIVFGGAGGNDAEAVAPKTIKCGELNVGLVFATYGVNFGSDGVVPALLDGIVNAIKTAKTTNDIVVAFVHWGTEYNTTPSPYQKEMAHKYIDAGADLVIGSHPHVIQPTEIYKNKFIAYSLGNFVFDQEAKGPKTEGVLYKTQYESKNLKIEAIPINIKNYFQPNILSHEEAADYLKQLGLENWQISLPRI